MALGTKHHGIRNVQGVRDRCRMVRGHWIWAGCVTTDGVIRMHAADVARNGAMRSMNGRRATWQLANRTPVPEGCRVYCTCGEPLCLNPACLVCRTVADHGKWLMETGKLKGLPSKIRANREIGLSRSKVTPEVFSLITGSDLTGAQITRLTGIGRTTISRIRTGKFKSHLSHASPFNGLGARA